MSLNLTQWLSLAGIVIDVIVTGLLIVLICKRAKLEASKVDEHQGNGIFYTTPETIGIVRPGQVVPAEKVTVFKDRPPCPKCSSKNAYKNGKRHNGQAYRCRKCLNSYVVPV
jgi:predicted RNA-binding Zn-ribbon protein involved in translation (DUF1610 family)